MVETNATSPVFSEFPPKENGAVFISALNSVIVFPLAPVNISGAALPDPVGLTSLSIPPL